MFPLYAKIASPALSDGLAWRPTPDAPADQSWFDGGLIVDGNFTPFIRAQFSEGRLDGVSLPGITSEHIGTTSEASINLPANHIQIFT